MWFVCLFIGRTCERARAFAFIELRWYNTICVRGFDKTIACEQNTIQTDCDSDIDCEFSLTNGPMHNVRGHSAYVCVWLGYVRMNTHVYNKKPHINKMNLNKISININSNSFHQDCTHTHTFACIRLPGTRTHARAIAFSWRAQFGIKPQQQQ